jgi:hypothetical protein
MHYLPPNCFLAGKRDEEKGEKERTDPIKLFFNYLYLHILTIKQTGLVSDILPSIILPGGLVKVAGPLSQSF